MPIHPELVQNLVCPQCKGGLHYTREEVLLCVVCRLCYPLVDGVPQLLMSEAMPLGPEGQIIPREEIATFVVESGPEEGQAFTLEKGTCKAIGRHIDDAFKTQIFNTDFTMSLDDHTQKLIGNYFSKHLSKKKKTPSKFSELGSFRRTPDLILTDPGISRLHAMVFYVEENVGLVDLVSRNGTFVNGREVETLLLKAGDSIQMGLTKLCLFLKAKEETCNP